MASSTSLVPYLRRTPSLWIGVFLLLPGLVFGILGLSLAISDARFASDGTTVQGIVLSKDIRSATNSTGTSHSVRYRFTLPDGRAFEGSNLVDVRDWERLEEGGPIAIDYLASDPSSNRTASSGSPVWEVLLLGLATAALLAGGYLVLRGTRTLMEDRRLLRVGVRARATIGAIEPTNIWINRRVQWEIAYRYLDVVGHAHERQSWTMPELQAKEFSRGSHGAILYDPERPERSLWLHEPWQADPAHHPVDATAPDRKSAGDR
jgi:hypothetical protein